MKLSPPRPDNIRMLSHDGRRIIELVFTERSVRESESMLYEYAFLLSSLRPGRKARVLIDLNGAVYDPRLFAAWKARIELFEGRVEKSAVIGASHLGIMGIQQISVSAARLQVPLSMDRGVVFANRQDALDWLSLDILP